MTRSLPWSPSEDAILWAHYEAGGTKACLPLLPGRTRKGVIQRAKRIHCHCAHRGDFVLSREDARLIKLLLAERTRLQAEMKQLSTKAIAEKMGCSMGAVEAIRAGKSWRRA